LTRQDSVTSDRGRLQALRRTLAREAGPSADAATRAAAVRRASAQLAGRLAPLIGVAGVAALGRRTLHIVERQHPELGVAPAPADDDDPFAWVERQLARQDADVASTAGLAVLTTFTDLLVVLIGETLTTRLLQETWPDDFARDRAEETAI
jgi:hypothetical protein